MSNHTINWSKVCNCCKVDKFLEEFPLSAISRGGVSDRCSACGVLSEKECTRCKQVKSTTAFYKKPDRNNSLSSECRKCLSDRQIVYRLEKRKKLGIVKPPPKRYRPDKIKKKKDKPTNE